MPSRSLEVEQVDDLALGQVRAGGPATSITNAFFHAAAGPWPLSRSVTISWSRPNATASETNVAGLRHAVGPGAAGVAALLDVELVDAADERVVADHRALEDRVQRLAVGGERHRLEAARAGEVVRAAEQERVVGRERRRGSGTGASSTRPFASVWTMNGPNSSPNQNVPSGARRTDSTSKSPPVRIRSSVFSLTIGNGTLPSGSLSVIASRIWTVALAAHSVFHAAGPCTGAG